MVELRYNRSESVRILYLGICQIMNAMKMSVYYISDSVKNQDITAKEVLGYNISYNVRYYSNVRVKIL